MCEVKDIMKQCSKCGEYLTKDRFYKSKNSPDGLYPSCKKCKKKSQEGYVMSAEAQERAKRRSKEWAEKNKEKRKEKARQQYLENRDKNLKNKFGIGIDEFNEILHKQGGKCLICGIKQEDYSEFFHVDHCHTTGKIRGLLCHKCNMGLGHFKDSVQLLQSAIDYLNSQDNNSRYIVDLRYKIKKVEMLDKETLEVLNVFDTISQASIYIKGNMNATSDIAQCCKGINKTAYGFKWQYQSKN